MSWTPAAPAKAPDAAKLSPEQVLAVSTDPELWARAYGYIPDRVTKQPIKWEPTPLQCRMFAEYRRKQRDQKPCRMVVPKIRRGGGSTGAEGILYVHAHNYPSRLGAIGTDYEVSNNMYLMAKFFEDHDKWPYWQKSKKRLDGDGLIQWPNESSWERYTADNPEGARSAGLQGYHASEVGRWQIGGVKDGKETLRSMLGAVPRRGFTVVIEESTAQGAMGAFFDRFKSGRWPEEATWWHKWADEFPQNLPATRAEHDQQFVRIFAAWYEDDENRAQEPVTPEEERYIRTTLDEDELKLIEKYRTEGPQGERLGDQAIKATLIEQLAWRRATIATEFDGDVDAFKQENPASPMEAFMSAGIHTFNVKAAARMREIGRTKPPQIGILDQQAYGDVTFRRADPRDGWLRLWEEPKPLMRYIIGVDTMGGGSVVKHLDKADYHAAHVIRAPFRDADNGQQFPARVVASLIPCQWDPDVLVRNVQLMSLLYGRCMVVPEVNNTGFAFLALAKEKGMHLYRRTETDKHTAVVTEYLGWVTDKETRPQLFSTGKRMIRNSLQTDNYADGLEVYDPTTLEQIQHCIRHPDGFDAAPLGKHDDSLLALLIGLHNLNGATLYREAVRRRTGPADRSAWRTYRGK